MSICCSGAVASGVKLWPLRILTRLQFKVWLKPSSEQVCDWSHLFLLKLIAVFPLWAPCSQERSWSHHGQYPPAPGCCCVLHERHPSGVCLSTTATCDFICLLLRSACYLWNGTLVCTMFGYINSNVTMSRSSVFLNFSHCAGFWRRCEKHLWVPGIRSCGHCCVSPGRYWRGTFQKFGWYSILIYYVYS